VIRSTATRAKASSASSSTSTANSSIGLPWRQAPPSTALPPMPGDETEHLFASKPNDPDGKLGPRKHPAHERNL
jgi:hypothetical protein